MKSYQSLLQLVTASLLIFIGSGCAKKNSNSVDPGTTDAEGVYTQQQGAITLKEFSTGRNLTPGVPDSGIASLVAGYTAFAIDVYHGIAPDGSNAVFSPYSLSTALAMTWGGARGTTEQDMATTLHFTAPQETLHPESNALDLALTAHAAAGGFELHIVNQVWGEKTWTVLPDYLKLLTVNYGAPLLLLDFINAPDASRQTINGWVAGQTQGRIQNLIPAGGIDAMTKMVLTNAIYFKAQWADTFQHEQTWNRYFYRSATDSVQAKFMHREGIYGYFSGADYSAVRLPYKGNQTSMLIILPAVGKTAQVEAGLSAAFIGSVRTSLHDTDLALYLPKFTFTTSSISMKPLLCSLGMSVAFGDSADFSGIDGTRQQRIGDVIHKAFIAVDERGTEAAAATAITIGSTSAAPPPMVFNANRPFIFLIIDDATGAVLFMGKLADPTAE